MTAITSHSQIVPQPATSTPALRAADQGVADALEWVLSDNTQRVYGTQWRLFTGWCDEVGLRSLPAELLTVARYLAARANSGALTVDVLAVIRLTAVQPRLRGRGFETAEQAEERGRYDVALVAVLSDAGLRRSEACLSPGATYNAGTTAAAVSPWFAPRPTSKPRAPWSPSPRCHARS